METNSAWNERVELVCTRFERERERKKERERQIDRQTETDRQTDRQTETENSNSKTLFYKDCSLGSVKNLSNN